MNRSLNIVLVIVILGALFAIGVNRWLQEYEGEKQHAVSYSHSTYRENRPSAAPSVGIKPQIVSQTKARGRVSGVRNLGGVSNLSRLNTSNRNTSLHYYNKPLYLSSNRTLHSLGGGSSLQSTTYNQRPLTGGYNLQHTNAYIGVYSGGIATLSMPAYSSSSYIDRSYLSDESTTATRSAARRNLNYGNSSLNTPMLYDMRSPITYNNLNN